MSKGNASTANRMAAAVLFALHFLSLSHAQTIRPVISEYSSKVAKGRIELVNPGLSPLTVIVEPKSFTVSERGVITYRPLDKNIQLKLSAMSFQIPPEQSYYLFYEARSEELPAWFVIYANIGGRKTTTGMNIRLDLPHTVYLLPKQSAGKADIQISLLGPSADKTHLTFRISNNGPWFARVLSSELVGKGKTTPGGGFPLYPHGSRILEAPCQGISGPMALRLTLQKFKIEEPLPETEDSQVCAP